VKSQQETIAHHQNFMDKQLSMVMPQNALVAPAATTENVPTKVIKHPLGSNLLTNYLVLLTSVGWAWVHDYFRHSHDVTSSTLILIGVALSLLSSGYVLYCAFARQKVNTVMETTPNLLMGIACTSILAGLIHSFWSITSPMPQGKSFFWTIMAVELTIVVAVNMIIITLGTALPSLHKRFMNWISSKRY